MEWAEACPNVDQFHREGEAQIDAVEGCRAILSRNWFSVRKALRFSVSQAINFGTYQRQLDQAAIIRALAGGVGVESGSKNWSTAFSVSTHDRLKFTGQYISQLQLFSFGTDLTIAPHTTLSCNYLTGNLVRGLRRRLQGLALLSRKESTSEQEMTNMLLPETTNSNESDRLLAKIERTTPDAHLALKVNYEAGNSVLGVEVAKKVFPRGLWLGFGSSYCKESTAVVTNCGVKARFSDTAVAAVTATVGPNFEKTMEEGLKEKVVQGKISAGYRARPDLYTFVSLSSFVRPFGRTFMCTGCEYTTARGLVSMEVNSDCQFNACLQTAESGSLYSCQIDPKNDSYKFGFGFGHESQLSLD